MNKFDAGAQRVRTGWLAFWRRVHDSENIVLRDGKHDLIFATEIEALKAANAAFLEYLNSPIVGLECMGGSIKEAKRATAEARLFKKKEVSIEGSAAASNPNGKGL